jgi:hypothetical protein
MSDWIDLSDGHFIDITQYRHVLITKDTYLGTVRVMLDGESHSFRETDAEALREALRERAEAL